MAGAIAAGELLLLGQTLHVALRAVARLYELLVTGRETGAAEARAVRTKTVPGILATFSACNKLTAKSFSSNRSQ